MASELNKYGRPLTLNGIMASMIQYKKVKYGKLPYFVKKIVH